MTLAKRPEDPSPFEEAAYVAGLRAGFHAAFLAVTSPPSIGWPGTIAAAKILDAAALHGLTGQDVIQ